MSTTSFTMYHADCVGNAANCLYPHKVTVTDAASMKAAMTKDYVFSAFKNSYRSIENYLSADALAVDCDNDHSDCPEAWVTPDSVATKFQAWPSLYITAATTICPKAINNRGHASMLSSPLMP